MKVKFSIQNKEQAFLILNNYFSLEENKAAVQAKAANDFLYNMHHKERELFEILKELIEQNDSLILQVKQQYNLIDEYFRNIE